MFGQSFKFFAPPTTKWRSLKFFAKLNGNHMSWLIFPNLASIRHLVSLNCIIWAKVRQLIEYSSYGKALFTITRPSNIQLLKFWLFNFSNFQTTFVKNFMKKLPGFKTYFESTYKSTFETYNGPLIFLKNLHKRAFCFLNFVKWGKY